MLVTTNVLLSTRPRTSGLFYPHVWDGLLTDETVPNMGVITLSCEMSGDAG